MGAGFCTLSPQLQELLHGAGQAAEEWTALRQVLASHLAAGLPFLLPGTAVLGLAGDLQCSVVRMGGGGGTVTAVQKCH